MAKIIKNGNAVSCNHHWHGKIISTREVKSRCGERVVKYETYEYTCCNCDRCFQEEQYAR